LSEIRQAITRYSANDPELPVNDPPPFTGGEAGWFFDPTQCRVEPAERRAMEDAAG
jgi:hypothetical protein